MATKISKKPGSLVDKNKDFMANFSYDMLNKNKPVPAQPTAMPSQPLRQAAPYDPVAEVQAATKGAQQMPTPQGYRRPVTRRGMSGAELDANGNDSGSGMNWFDKNNSPAQVDARNARQGVLDQRRGDQMAAAGASAVAERKALQEMGQAPFQLAEQNRSANSVKGNDGYMTLFDGKGNAVGTNRPPAQKTNWAAQNAAYPNQVGPALSATNPKNPNLQAQIQQGFNQDAQQPRPMGPPKPASNFLDSYATPGGNAASVVGAPSAPGTPVGGSFSATPPGMQRPDSSFLDLPSAPPAPPRFNQLPPGAGPQTQLPPNMGPRSQPSPASMGPAPQFNPDQQAALAKLQGLSNFSATVGDLYPGNDWEYLKRLFPQVDTSKYLGGGNLLDAYRNLGR